jgi:DNA-binding transcriptional LysR family regulator
MMVSAGRGITLMPESLHLGNGTLARPLVEPLLNCEISLVTVAGRPHPPPVRHLLRATLAHQWGPTQERVTGRSSSATPALQPLMQAPRGGRVPGG